MKPVLDLQITALLYYLRVALRSDNKLCGDLDASPDAIVKGILRIQPVYEKDDEVIYPANMLPCLAAYLVSGEPDYSVSVKGQKETVRLWYVFDVPVDDVAVYEDARIPVSGDEKAEIWKRAVWDRICFYFRQGQLPTEVSTTQVTFDLFSDGQIDTLYPGRVDYFPPGRIGGFKADLAMTRTGPTFADPSPGLLKLITFDLGPDIDAVDAGPDVSGRVDTSGS